MSKVITFYSYKGGVGRSMALANIGWLLASNGYRVLMIDWDLESPGLHLYYKPFLRDGDLGDTRGLIELLTDYQGAARQVLDFPTLDAIPEYLVEPGSYVSSIQYSFPGAGGIDLIPAGCQSAVYSDLVGAFSWDSFYRHYRGRDFLDALKKSLLEEYDFVLIDSRTGVADSAGACTSRLADTLVVLVAPYGQSIDGGVRIAEMVDTDRIRVLPVLARTDRSEHRRLQQARAHAYSKLADVLSKSVEPGQQQEYWGETEIPYVPIFAYEESLAPFREGRAAPGSTLASYVHLARYIAQDDDIKAPDIPEEERERVLGWFEQWVETKVNIEGLQGGTRDIIGRELALAELDRAWQQGRDRLLCLLGTGGSGKTSIVRHWLAELGQSGHKGATHVFAYTVDSEVDFAESLGAFLGVDGSATPNELGEILGRKLAKKRFLIVLDGMELHQDDRGNLTSEFLKSFLETLQDSSRGMCLITSRQRLSGLREDRVKEIEIGGLSMESGVSLLESFGIHGAPWELERAVRDAQGHPLLLTLMSTVLREKFNGDISKRFRFQASVDEISKVMSHLRDEEMVGRPGVDRTVAVLDSYSKLITSCERRKELASVLSLFDGGATLEAVMAVSRKPPIEGLTDVLATLSTVQVMEAIQDARRLSLVLPERSGNGNVDVIEMHPMIHRSQEAQLHQENPEAWRMGHERLYDYFKDEVREGSWLPEQSALAYAIRHGCRAERYRDAFREVYLKRLLKGGKVDPSTNLTALLNLVHFFRDGDWGMPIDLSISEKGGLDHQDLGVLLSHAGLVLTVRRGYSDPNVGTTYRKALEYLPNEEQFPILYGLVTHHFFRAELSEADACVARLRRLADEVPDGRMAAVPMATHALIEYARGNYAEAASVFLDAQDLNPPITRTASLTVDLDVFCLSYAALATWALGRDGEASDLIEDALEKAAAGNRPYTQACANVSAAWLSVFQLRVDEAARHTRFALQIAKRHRYPFWISHGRALSAWVRAMEGDTEQAIGDMHKAITDYRRSNSRIFESGFCASFADALVRHGRHEYASVFLDRAEDSTAAANGERFCHAEIHRLRAEVLIKVGASKEDIEHQLLEANRTANEQGAKAFKARISATEDAMRTSMGPAPSS